MNRDFCCVGGFSKQYTNCSNLAYKTTTAAPFYWLVLANILIGVTLIRGDNSDYLNEDTLYVVDTWFRIVFFYGLANCITCKSRRVLSHIDLKLLVINKFVITLV